MNCPALSTRIGIQVYQRRQDDNSINNNEITLRAQQAAPFQ
ncbi:hypothetical protein ACQKDS_16065 [Serratia sp. NPDC078593]